MIKIPKTVYICRETNRYVTDLLTILEPPRKCPEYDQGICQAFSYDKHGNNGHQRLLKCDARRAVITWAEEEKDESFPG